MALLEVSPYADVNQIRFNGSFLSLHGTPGHEHYIPSARNVKKGVAICRGPEREKGRGRRLSGGPAGELDYLPAFFTALSAAMVPQVAHRPWPMPPMVLWPAMLAEPMISPAR